MNCFGWMWPRLRNHTRLRSTSTTSNGIKYPCRVCPGAKQNENFVHHVAKASHTCTVYGPGFFFGSRALLQEFCSLLVPVIRISKSRSISKAACNTYRRESIARRLSILKTPFKSTSVLRKRNMSSRNAILGESVWNGAYQERLRRWQSIYNPRMRML